MKASITEYIDYRDYLYDFYKAKHETSSFFSYRFISQKVSVDPSHIAKVFSKARHIPDRSISAFSKLCGFKKQDAEFFKLLVKFNKAKTDKEAKEYYEALLSLRDIPSTQVKKNQYEFYSKWYYTAIHILLHNCKFEGDYKWLANELTPSITVAQAKAAIKLLLELGMLEEDENGHYSAGIRFVTSGDTAQQMAIKNYQRESILLAADSLMRHKKQDRNISTVTISVSHDDLPAIDEIIRDFRQTLLRYSDEAAVSDAVYQLNVQLFPLTKGGIS